VGGATVFNDGTVPFFPIFHFGLVGEDGSFHQLPPWDLPGTLFKPGQAYYYPFVTWIPEDVPTGTYSWSMLMECVTAWPSVDGSGHLPWYPGQSTGGAEGPVDPSTGYYPFPTTDPDLGYPVETEEDTDFYEFTLDEPSHVTIPTEPWTTDPLETDSDFGWSWYLEEYSPGTHTLYVEVSDELYESDPVEVDRDRVGAHTLEITVTDEVPEVILYGENVFSFSIENSGLETYMTNWTINFWNEAGDEYRLPCDVPDAMCSPGANSFDLECEIPESVPLGEYSCGVSVECLVAREVAVDDLLGGHAMSRSLGVFDSYAKTQTFGIVSKDLSKWAEPAKETPTWDSYCTTNNEQVEEGTFTGILPYLHSLGKSALDWGERAIKKAYNFDNLVKLARDIVRTPLNPSADEPEDVKSLSDIPGFPYETVALGLTLGPLSLYLSRHRQRGLGL
jgi:hypothetical protein